MVSAEVSSEIGIRELLDAGLHFGHQTKRWNPKMRPYIFDKRNGIHIIDLAQSLAHLKAAQRFVHDLVASGRNILFVGTKKQAQEVVKELAQRTKQFYVTNRWLGGTLTNSPTVRLRVKHMRMLEAMENDGAFESMPKKEVAKMRHELQKLQKNLSGIADMANQPGAVFVVDIMREAIAVKEANRLHIPVIAIVDTNCDPDPIDYPIPGNDDAIRAIKLIANAVGDTVLSAYDEFTRVSAETAQKRAAEQAAAGAKAPGEAQTTRARPGSRKPRSDAGGAGRPRRRTADKGNAEGGEAAPAKAESGKTTGADANASAGEEKK